MGLNPMNLTPNLDHMPRRAVLLGILQPAGLRAGTRQYLYRAVSQPPQRMAQWGRATGQVHHTGH
jgi:hypothetical protein